MSSRNASSRGGCVAISLARVGSGSCSTGMIWAFLEALSVCLACPAAASAVVPSQLGVAAARIDDQEPGRLVADRLGVMRQRAVKQDVVSRTGLDHRLALRDPKTASQDDVVLVARMRVKSGAMADRHGPFEDRQVARDAAVDLRHATALATLSA